MVNVILGESPLLRVSGLESILVKLLALFFLF
ncbi:hypothetical protein Taro_032408 [Colocasia esculenta]|uniref:Uncharacterized protein n=1 Tax=Colocasia esculenta TaxID=4460 RepID=A0A843VSL2_COLES|nr:hypothetical protein [Colocasia esculenta]